MMHADDVASVILARSGSWRDALSLQKLLYYVQAWHLAVTDEPLFGEQIKAWKNGPVVPQVWHSRRDKGTRRAAAQNVDGIALDELTSDLIDLVLASYGSMSGEELMALTHVEEPWQDARGDLPSDADGYRPISTEAMANFYRAERKLGGRTAADLAAGGIHVRAPRREDSQPLDVRAILASLPEEYSDPGEDPWGGANLDSGSEFSDEGIVGERRRVYVEP
ncbi:type II toxin-antitoxin system antitoxin SocA domain-containing protein [Saccharomonospora sp. NPDC006951]